MSDSPASEVSVSVLDDHLFVREALCTSLQSAGLKVVGRYAEGAAFLRGLDTEPPSAAVMDLVLRGVDGLSVLEVAHQRHPEVALLVLSGSGQQGMVERSFQLGASGFLDKSNTDASALVDAVRGVVQGKRIYPMNALASLGSLALPEDANRRLLHGISTREREVLAHVAEGADNLKIAALLNISERTVRAHVSSLYRKLSVENRTQMALLAQKLRLTLDPKVN